MFTKLPSLKGLKTFEAAARLKSFKHAAQELNVTATAVSHQIRNLEKELAMTLFVRHSRQVQLTHEGQVLALEVNQALAQMQSAVNRLTARPDHLVVNTTSAFASFWLAPKLGQFAQEEGQEIRLETSHEPFELELDRRIDLVIRYGPVPDKDTGIQRLFDEKLKFFASADYWQNAQRHKTVTLLLPKWQSEQLPALNYETLIEEQFLKHEYQIQYQYYHDENQLFQASLAGTGAALLNTHFTQHALLHGWLLEQPDCQHISLAGYSYYLIVPQRHRRNPSCQTFVRWLHKSFSN